jgi:hypothetical protein
VVVLGRTVEAVAEQQLIDDDLVATSWLRHIHV